VAANRFRIPPKELEEMLPQQLLMLKTAAGALADAGIGREGNQRSGVFIGIALDLNSTNFSFRWSLAEQAARWAKEAGLDLSPEELNNWTTQLRDTAGPPLTANRTMGALGNIVASRIAREFRFGGPGFTLSSEESSGIRALETAVRQLRQGRLIAPWWGRLIWPVICGPCWDTTNRGNCPAPAQPFPLTRRPTAVWWAKGLRRWYLNGFPMPKRRRPYLRGHSRHRQLRRYNRYPPAGSLQSCCAAGLH